MKRDWKKYYSDFLKKQKPPNVKGDFYGIRDFKEDKYIKPYNRKYNSRGNVINEAVENPKDIIPGLPVNTRVKFDDGLMVKAIQNGLVLLISYSGDKDNWKGGRERVIYPMVIGVNRNTGNTLIRGWHLTGWSVSKKRNVKKEWRLFKSSNIKFMMFTGDFYRMAPKGYKMNDRAMTQKLIKSADFNEIRRNQDALVKSGIIGNVEEQEISDGGTIAKIDARFTDTTLDLRTPFDNEYMSEYKPNDKLPNLKLTFMKSLNRNEWVVILGALGTIGRTVKLNDEPAIDFPSGEKQTELTESS